MMFDSIKKKSRKRIGKSPAGRQGKNRRLLIQSDHKAVCVKSNKRVGLKKDEDILREVQSLLDEVDFDRYTPAGSRKLSLQIDSVVNEILKILILHKFTEEELEIILDLVRYRITGTDYIFRRSTRKGEQ